MLRQQQRCGVCKDRIGTTVVEGFVLCDECLFSTGQIFGFVNEMSMLESYFHTTEFLVERAEAEMNSPKFRPGFSVRVRPEFAQLLRYSFLVLLLMSVERKLSDFDDSLTHWENLKPRPKVSQAIIATIKKHLSDVLELSENWQTAWCAVESMVAVRNCIVHDFGHASKCSHTAALKKLLDEGVPGFTLTAGRVTLQSTFCEFALKAVKQLFQELCTSAGFGKIPFLHGIGLIPSLARREFRHTS